MTTTPTHALKRFVKRGNVLALNGLKLCYSSGGYAVRNRKNETEMFSFKFEEAYNFFMPSPH